ncbi:Uncharacterised protein [Salmonella enterica subsp. enterica]|nr:Uncharacterised protein [Salmonella enterica subsp. enterica]
MATIGIFGCQQLTKISIYSVMRLLVQIVTAFLKTVSVARLQTAPA